MTKFKKNFVRYFPYVLLSTGIFIVVGTYYQFAWAEMRFYYNQFTGKKYQLELSRNVAPQKQGFTSQVGNNAIKIQPVDTNFGLVIERINLNAPIIKDVNVINENDYLEALKNGIAHASFSGYPTGDNSNVYLFAHSSNNFWELGKYATVFNEIHKLNLKDQINLFYEGKRYVYEVENKILINDFKVDQTIYESIGPTLTLQTCYPTGTSLYRLVIRASLVGVFDYAN